MSVANIVSYKIHEGDVVCGPCSRIAKKNIGVGGMSLGMLPEINDWRKPFLLIDRLSPDIQNAGMLTEYFNTSRTVQA